MKHSNLEEARPSLCYRKIKLVIKKKKTIRWSIEIVINNVKPNGMLLIMSHWFDYVCYTWVIKNFIIQTLNVDRVYMRLGGVLLRVHPINKKLVDRSLTLKELKPSKTARKWSDLPHPTSVGSRPTKYLAHSHEFWPAPPAWGSGQKLKKKKISLLYFILKYLFPWECV